jgi:DNA-binding helix-hairpin-helix protein with protein kinase domain
MNFFFEALLQWVLNSTLQSATQYPHSNAQVRPVHATQSQNSHIEGTMTQVFDPDGKPKNLDGLIAKPGGEGSVYKLKDKAGILVKVYHTEKLNANRANYQTKIDEMVKLKDQFTDIGVCWPLMSVYDSSQQWIGYAMKQGVGLPMRYLAHGVAYKKHFPNLNRVILCHFLLSFLKNVEALHSKNVYIGDYNLLNFLCAQDVNKVTMIDCDSYQVTIGGRQFPCPVGSPDLTPIEHHDMDFKKVTRTVHSEEFSLAIIIFECLMLGRHPYDIVGGDDPVTNLQNGNFPYGKGNRGIPKGPWYNIWSYMPFRIKNLFIQTFTEGVRSPDKRASVKNWQDEISIYLQEMEKEWHSKDISPQMPKPKEYKGNRTIVEG